jgi:hypothetical protein
MSNGHKQQDGHRRLEELARATGGSARFPRTGDEIDSLARELAHQIREQYTSAYSPLNQALDGSYRRIRLEARGGDPWTVAVRAGYWAVPR